MAISKSLSSLRGAAPALNERARKKALAASMVTAPTGAQPTAKGAAGMLGTSQAKAAGDIGLQSQKDLQGKIAATSQTELRNLEERGKAEVSGLSLATNKKLADQREQLRNDQMKGELAARKEITNMEIKQVERLNRFGIEQDNRLLSLSRKQRTDLANLGRDVKGKLFDANLRFARDEAGRKFTNDRQYMMWKMSEAKSDIELNDFMREYEQKTDMKLQMMKSVSDRLEQALHQGYMDNRQKLDNNMRMELRKYKRFIDKKMKEEAAEKKNKMAAWQGIGMVAGAVIGTFIMPGAGTAAGASIGGAAGTAVGGVATEAGV